MAFTSVDRRNGFALGLDTWRGDGTERGREIDTMVRQSTAAMFPEKISGHIFILDSLRGRTTNVIRTCCKIANISVTTAKKGSGMWACSPSQRPVVYVGARASGFKCIMWKDIYRRHHQHIREGIVDGTAELVSRDQNLRRELIFPVQLIRAGLATLPG